MAWNWKEQREKPAFLALADGTILRGHSVGAARDGVGEVVFNTGMTGYQEILSDPSYSGQFVTMTYPEIGNTGINDADEESHRFFANGFILHELNATSNWRATESLRECLVRRNIPAIAGLDTRALTTRLRTGGTQKAYMAVGGHAIREQEAVRLAQEWCGLDGQDYAARVSCEKPYRWDEDGTRSTSWGLPSPLPPADLKVVAYDFGIKWNILRNLRQNGMAVTVVPAKTPPADVLALKPDGVLLSNGPADPAAVTYAVDAARALLGKVPLMGICLGHQILGIAVGGRTFRLKFGHHGCNHPVKTLDGGAVAVTSQNHNFAVDPQDAKVEVTHLNLNDNTVEGFRHKSEPMFAVQYHPEAGPGPHDAQNLFGDFRTLIRGA